VEAQVVRPACPEGHPRARDPGRGRSARGASVLPYRPAFDASRRRPMSPNVPHPLTSSRFLAA